MILKYDTSWHTEFHLRVFVRRLVAISVLGRVGLVYVLPFVTYGSTMIDDSPH